MVDAPVERRRHGRYVVQVTARVVHEAGGRSFPCHCSDISAGGARLAVPAAMPVRPGHAVRLTGVEAFADRVSQLDDGELPAIVVRVNRESLITQGHVSIAVRFLSA